ncbi:MAG: DUF72 domain-containing protein [Thermoplasmata archaeon]|nr:DUF72 domain-containing protein [Thermoplasmata archaeon]
MHIGVCGFCEKRQSIYKDFDVLELQNTFYDFVREEWLKKLREESKDFEFTLKALQIITHKKDSPTYRRYRSSLGNMDNYGNFRDTEEVNEAMRVMLSYANILNSKIIIFQTPPSFSENDENIKNIYEFFKRYRKNNIIYGWENRGKWNSDTLKEIFESLGIIHVVDPFFSESITKEMRYFRLHGKGGYSYSYTNDDLMYLKGKVKNGDYIMFNNTNMCNDARSFRKMIHEI